MQTYVTPILLYGMEVLLPKNNKHIGKLEVYQKQLLKQILSLPENTADSAVYILSGFLPVEAQIHKRALTFFRNICDQPEHSVEKRLAYRQLSINNFASSSWFMDIKKLFMKYDLIDPLKVLENPHTKRQWKVYINKHIEQYWIENSCHFSAFYDLLF